MKMTIKERADKLSLILKFPYTKVYKIHKLKNAIEYSIYASRMKFKSKKKVYYHNWRYYHNVKSNETHWLFVNTVMYKNKWGKMVEGIMRFPEMHHHHEYTPTPQYLSDFLKDDTRIGKLRRNASATFSVGDKQKG
jgi:hypothetical protein